MMTKVVQKDEEIKGGRKRQYDWPNMRVGDEFISNTPGTAQAGNRWAERKYLDWYFSCERLGRNKYLIKREK